jgi:hypothetical protein
MKKRFTIGSMQSIHCSLEELGECDEKTILNWKCPHYINFYQFPSFYSFYVIATTKYRSHLARQNIDISASPTKSVTCTTGASTAQKFIINRQKLFAMSK